MTQPLLVKPPLPAHGPTPTHAPTTSSHVRIRLACHTCLMLFTVHQQGRSTPLSSYQVCRSLVVRLGQGGEGGVTVQCLTERGVQPEYYNVLRCVGWSRQAGSIAGATAAACPLFYHHPSSPSPNTLPLGQPEGLDIYTDHLALGSRFLSLRRYWSRTGCPAMDLDYLIDDVMGPAGVVPLDWDAVLASPLPLKVVASSLTSLRAEVLDDFVDAADLAECLKASANVPEIVGGPRSHRGHELVDAAVFEPLPVKAALRDGCTHVLALCSR